MCPAYQHDVSSIPAQMKMVRYGNFMFMLYIKAETQDATNRCDTLPRQVVTTNRLVWHVKIIVAATEFCRSDLSHEFKLVWIRATDRSHKKKRKQPCRSMCTLLQQVAATNLNQPMRKRHLLSSMLNLETSSHLPSSKFACVHWTSVLTQRLVAAAVQTRRLVATMCRIVCLGLKAAMKYTRTSKARAKLLYLLFLLEINTTQETDPKCQRTLFDRIFNPHFPILGEFVLDGDFCKALNFVVLPNKRVSLALFNRFS